MGAGKMARLVKIQSVFVRYGLSRMMMTPGFACWVNGLLYLLPWSWGTKKRGTKGERLRCALEELGPIFIKFGQLLSTRRDLLPEDIILELAKLQDKAPSFPGRVAKQIIERALHQKN